VVGASGVVLLSSLSLASQSRRFLCLAYLSAFKEGDNSTTFALSSLIIDFLAHLSRSSYVVVVVAEIDSLFAFFALISSRRLCPITNKSLFVFLQPATCCLSFCSSRLGFLTFRSFTSYSLATMMTQQPLNLFVYFLSPGSSTPHGY
jgi:hypothetical protein